LGLNPFPAPMAILSQPRAGRSACINCGFCLGFGCEVKAKSSSLASMIPIAEKTGRCEIRPNSYVHKIELDARGRAVGAVYFYELDPQKVGFYGGGGLDARFDMTPINFAAGGGLPPDTPRWGKKFKDAIAHNFTRTVEIFSHGTSLPKEENSFSLDPELKDAWGLPALRMTYKDHADDIKLAKWLNEYGLQILDAAGARQKW